MPWKETYLHLHDGRRIGTQTQTWQTQQTPSESLHLRNSPLSPPKALAENTLHCPRDACWFHRSGGGICAWFDAGCHDALVSFGWLRIALDDGSNTTLYYGWIGFDATRCVFTGT